MAIYTDRAIELSNTIQSASEITRIISQEFNIEHSDNLRRNVSYTVKKHKNRGVFEECEAVGIDIDDVNHYWYKGKSYSIHAKAKGEVVDFESIINRCFDNKEPVKKAKYKIKDTADRLVWTDVHVGMDASRKGLALYPTEWNEKLLYERIDEMVAFVLNNKKSNVLFLDDLGDYLDGWDGLTTRGGHKLPQNMTNEESFDNGLKAKLRLIDGLCDSYEYIKCHNVCNDNHAGSFGYILNSAFKQIVDHKYTNVEVINTQKFIDWYFIGGHCILYSHGKDGKALRFGFKPALDPRQIEKIDQFIKHNDLYKESKYIEFGKGDSHQALFDMATSDDFHYFNFPAFSPSSEWVQTNFKKGRSGFVFMVYNLDNPNKIVMPYFFNENKK